MVKNTLSIPSMKCDGCVTAIETALTGAGATNVEVLLDSKTAIYESNQDAQALIAAIKVAGFVASLEG